MSSSRAQDELFVSVGKQRKDEAEVVYMFWFNKALEPFEFNDRFKLQQKNQKMTYGMPSQWQGEMYGVVRRFFDYDMMRKYLDFHRRAIYAIENEIELFPIRYGKDLPRGDMCMLRTFAFRNDITELWSFFKHIDAHRAIVCMLNLHMAIMLSDIQRVSEIHIPPDLYHQQ